MPFSLSLRQTGIYFSVLLINEQLIATNSPNRIHGSAAPIKSTTIFFPPFKSLFVYPSFLKMCDPKRESPIHALKLCDFFTSARFPTSIGVRCKVFRISVNLRVSSPGFSCLLFHNLSYCIKYLYFIHLTYPFFMHLCICFHKFSQNGFKLGLSWV